MARVPLIEAENHPELKDLVARIQAARRGRVINVYRLLLNSPALAETWFAHNNAVRWCTALDGRLREMVIVRIGYLTQGHYIVNQHVPKLALAEGLSLLECEALKNWRGTALFDGCERAVLAYTDAMTQDVKVPEDVFEPLRGFFNTRQIVELTVLIGTYAMHTRVMQALEIDPEPAVAP
jgi:4-carboxymuconolactone decarboxylase